MSSLPATVQTSKRGLGDSGRVIETTIVPLFNVSSRRGEHPQEYQRQQQDLFQIFLLSHALNRGTSDRDLTGWGVRLSTAGDTVSGLMICVSKTLYRF